jgi:hypothetical protein
MRKRGVALPYLTAKQLAQEERQLHLGLTVEPKNTSSLGLPQADNFVGSVVPRPDLEPDLFTRMDDEGQSLEWEENEDQDRDLEERNRLAQEQDPSEFDDIDFDDDGDWGLED